MGYLSGGVVRFYVYFCKLTILDVYACVVHAGFMGRLVTQSIQSSIGHPNCQYNDLYVLPWTALMFGVIDASME